MRTLRHLARNVLLVLIAALAACLGLGLLAVPAAAAAT